jgi:pantothenate kinase
VHVTSSSSSSLSVSFADDITSTGLNNNNNNNDDDGEHGEHDDNYKIQQQQQQQQQQSTFPECVVLSWECDVEAQIREELSRRGPLSGHGQVSNQPYLVGVVGIPGSGKSTSSSILTDCLADQGSLLLPVDGYHYSIAQLLLEFDDDDDADDAIYRRGAADTFDVASLRTALERIRFGDDSQVKVPGFDHARGDPEVDAHTFDRQQHSVVIVEGLYLLHDSHGWESIQDYLDLTIFVDADVDTCVDRLKIRNQCIPGYTKEEIDLRCNVVDRANAMAVDQSRQRAHVVVQGIASKNNVR